MLATLAISQPLLGILGENPTFFTAHSSSPGQIVVFAITVALAPALVLSAAMLAGHTLSERLGEHIFRAAMATLTFLFVIQVVDVIGRSAWLVVTIAVAGAYGLMTLYLRHDRVRSVVSVLAVLGPAVVVHFLFFSAANSVVFPDDVEAVTLETLLGTDLETDLGDSRDDEDQQDSASFDGVEPPNAGNGRDGPESAAAGGNTAGQASMVERLNERFPPIYLLVFDELPWNSLLDRTGHIDPVRYPNFARLAETSHVFENATTVGFTTEAAVPALLASTIETQPAPVYSMYPHNLFTLLGGVYDVSSSDPLVDLCPDSVCNGSPPEQILDWIAANDQTTATTAPTTTAAPATPAATTAPTASAAPTTTVATSSTISSATTSSPSALTRDDTDPSDGESLALLLFKDAAIVFGHLVAPEGTDLGLPSIGATWGDFGGDLTTTTAPIPTAQEPTSTTTGTTTTAGTTTTQTSTTTTTQSSLLQSAPTTTLLNTTALETGIDTDPMDPERIAAERTAFLDSLISLDTRVFDFRREVAAIQPKEHPRLHYLHTLLPHVPWRLRPDGSIYADIGLPGYFSKWDNDEITARFGQQRHLLQLGFTDQLLGEYLDRLEEIGDFDRAIVIITADHGISFVAGERSRGVGELNVGGIAGVPLLLKEPHQTNGTVLSQPVQLIDVVPTIAALLEVDAPWDFAGRDLFSAQPAAGRAVDGIGGSVRIPEGFTAVTKESAQRTHEVFGDGASGSLYGLGGAHALIGTAARDRTSSRSAHCWVLERPTAIPEPDGAIGYVFGQIDAPPGAPIAFAVVVDGIVAGTARSFEDGPEHRVFAIGDSQYWRGADSTVELHEIVNDRLAPIPSC